MKRFIYTLFGWNKKKLQAVRQDPSADLVNQRSEESDEIKRKAKEIEISNAFACKIISEFKEECISNLSKNSNSVKDLETNVEEEISTARSMNSNLYEIIKNIKNFKKLEFKELEHLEKLSKKNLIIVIILFNQMYGTINELIDAKSNKV